MAATTAASPSSPVYQVTCSAPVNIAVVKYWGKRNEELLLPLNSSLSGTLNIAQLSSRTTVAASKSFGRDRIWLNGKEEDISNPRLQNCLRGVRRVAGALKDGAGQTLIGKDEWDQYHVHIVSHNNFPTAAGLASSASGYCCLVYALGQLMAAECSTADLSAIARMGSGSACRSMFGGFVKWEQGTREDGADSIAVQVAPETHWPEMQVVVLVVSDHKKDVGSTVGMAKSVETNPHLHHRAREIVPERMRQMEAAIAARDFQTFADLTMKDSDNFHDVCAKTEPPLFYLNDISRQIQAVIHAYNAFHKELRASYTYDAGPNAVLYLPRANLVPLLATVLHFFPPAASADADAAAAFFKTADASLAAEVRAHQLPADLLAAIAVPPAAGALKYILHTTLGPGPQRLDESHSLVDAATGLPKSESRL